MYRERQRRRSPSLILLFPFTPGWLHTDAGLSHYPRPDNFQMDIPTPSSLLNSRCAHLAACSTAPLDHLRGILDIELNFCPFPLTKQAPPTVIPFSISGVYILLVGQAKTSHIHNSTCGKCFGLHLQFIYLEINCSISPLLSLRFKPPSFCLR